jgi:UDP-N-acetylmuramoyl-L-alanyl-D-glutamate--2,6-diaminopimelate ligase
VLSTLRPLAKHRLICVFGCGGDRDPTKRPKMGAAVAELADLAVVTSDNPRTEESGAIIAQVVAGMREPESAHVVPDRAAAIRYALTEAEPGDVVVIAGKGHEDYQIVGAETRAFSDRDTVRARLAEAAAC